MEKEIVSIIERPIICFRLYQLKRITDGLFSNGAKSPKFNKIGKIWRDLKPLKDHINSREKEKLYNEDTEWEDLRIVTYETYEGNVSKINLPHLNKD